MTVRF